MCSLQNNSVQIGAGEVDITPTKRAFLYGYPHVRRTSEGVHDPLLASALCIRNTESTVIFIACDVIWVPREITHEARRQIELALGVPQGNIMVTATHTHSGPVTSNMLSNQADPVVPIADQEYLEHLQTGIINAAVEAHRRCRPATLAWAMADSSGLGTNRRDPAGPSIPQMPVLTAHCDESCELLAIMTICSMHPTVLHEDSRWISGDFPGFARQYLRQRHNLRCPLVYHMGASGNQSPRHVVKANTLEEAGRLGALLGEQIMQAISQAEPIDASSMDCRCDWLTFPLRTMPPIAEAQARRDAAVARLHRLQQEQADKALIRTAECDVFGREETVTLAEAASDGRLQQAAVQCLPAEVQVIRIGEHFLVGWPGEIFVEYALELRQQHPHAYVISLANGDLQGYLVTQQAIDEGAYEAGNALFASPESPQALVQTTLHLIARMQR